MFKSPWKTIKELEKENINLNKQLITTTVELTNAREQFKARLLSKCETVKALHEELRNANEYSKELEKRIGNPSEVIKKLLGRPLKWKDYSKMTPDTYRAYYNEAQALLNNEVFISEMAHLEYDLINDIAKNTEDFQQVLNRRFSLNGMLAFKEYVESLPKVNDIEEITEEESVEAI